MRQPLTKKQSRVLDYLSAYYKREGYMPSRAEIAKHMGSKFPNTAQAHLVLLEKKGYIEFLKINDRNVRILK